MLVGTLLVGLLSVQDGVVLRGTHRAFSLVVTKTPLVKRVHAEEMNRGQLKGTGAGCTLHKLENLGTERKKLRKKKFKKKKELK
jgi:hypothetical protein